MLVQMGALPLGVSGDKYRFGPQTQENAFRRRDLPPKREHDKKLVKSALGKCRNPLSIFPKMAKIPALAAISKLSAFPRNPPGRPVDVGKDGRAPTSSRRE